MTSLLHILPLACFFLTYQWYDIYIATLALMVASVIAFPLGWVIHKSINRTEAITLGFILVFGMATLFFHNANFIMWKVSIIFWVLSIGLLINKWFNKQSTSYMLLHENIDMPEPMWHWLDNGIITYGFIMGGINWLIFSFMSEATWVKFKTFGLFGSSIVFSLLIAVFISRHAKSIQ